MRSRNMNLRVKKSFSLLLVLVLLLSSFPSFAETNDNLDADNVMTKKQDLKEVALEKITPEVKEELLKDEEYVGVLVYLKDRVDPKRVAQVNSIGKTPYERKLSSRKALVNALMNKAEDTQYDLIKYLKQEEKKGNVEEFESFYIVNMVYVKGTEEVIENIAYMGEVEKIYLNKFIELEKPIKSNNMNTSSEDDGIEWNIKQIEADKVWDLGYDGSGVVVGLIDTGADWEHEALMEKWRGYDPENPNPEGNWFDAVYGEDMPYDILSIPHGSHVLGTILGQDPEGKNKIGVAPGATWIAAKAFIEEGGYDNWLIAAGEWMLSPGGDVSKAPDIINNSWGGGAGVDDWYRDIVIAWREAGILPVFAAGNQKLGEPAPWPGSIENPGNLPESFAVAATDINNRRAYFSKLGPTPYDESLIKPEISAPGVNIRSSIPWDYEDGWSGTSMAAPHISGTAALLLSADNSFTVDDLEDVIEGTATPLIDDDYAESPNFGYGYGLVNAYNAITSAAIGSGTISGKVLVDGEDLEEPEIIHEPITVCYEGSNTFIQARVRDDVSITDAKVYVKQLDGEEWKAIPMERRSGDHKDGVYVGTIDYELIKVPGFIYKIRVEDYAGSIVESEEYSVDVYFGIVPDEYEMNFETYPAGWRISGEWQWGEPTTEEPIPYSGSKLVATNLDGRYSPYSNSLLLTPPIDLRDDTLESASLRFYHWYETYGTSSDLCRILIFNDDGDWTQVGQTYSGDGKHWDEVAIDLSDYIGSETPVYVGFWFTADMYKELLGWYIDDVRLVGIDEDPPTAPTRLVGEFRVAGIQLGWNPSPEPDVGKYEIYRSEVSGEGYEFMGESSENFYLDMEVEEDKTYYYVVKAVDFAGNESEYSEEVSVKAGSVETIYFSNFEEDGGGFTADGENNSWEWGEPTSGPNAAHTGTKVWATNLSGDYLYDSDCWIESPEIKIPEEGVSTLSFTHWYKTDYYHICVVGISTDGEEWFNITPGGEFSGDLARWINTEISLEEYKGQNVRFRFWFMSDDWDPLYPGWYIDNVLVARAYQNNNLVNNAIENTKVESIAENYLLDKNSRAPNKIEINLREAEELTNEVDENIISNDPGGIPVDAVVTVLETEKSVRTSVINGTYSLNHPANREGETWTLRVNAYGYYPEERNVKLEKDSNIIEDFHLKPIPTGNIVGKVKDRITNEPIVNAKVRVKDDFHYDVVYTDEDGNFRIPNVYEGMHILEVRSDEYHTGEIEVEAIGDKDVSVEISLKKYIGYPEELVYDDGTAEDASVIYPANGGVVMRMTPFQFGKVVGTRILFEDESWPKPGGDRVGIVLFDSDENGLPGEKIGETKFVTIVRGEWNYIDLNDFDFSTDRDFYIGTYQHQPGELMPGVCLDKNSKNHKRAYGYIDDSFWQMDYNGNAMIRGVMNYSLDEPEITNLPELSYTNEDSIVVEGIINNESQINIYLNGNKIKETTTQDKEFNIEIELENGENEIYTTGVVNEQETEPSNIVKVIKDQDKPILNVTNPMEDININQEVIYIVGDVVDKYFDKLTVNEEDVQVGEDGNFNHRIFVDEGENIITIKATDLARNETVVERKVYVKLDDPVITDIEPSQNATYKTGETVRISFMAETDGKGYFRIAPPIAIASEDDTRLPMAESEETPGLYEGTWIVPEGFTMTNGLIEVEFIDIAGNRTTAIAPGRITVGEISDTLPMENLPSNTVIVDDEAFDIRYLNNNKEAQMKLIEWYGEGKEVYIKLSEDKIVNIRGEVVGIDVLPDELTYYDEFGDARVYKK